MNIKINKLSIFIRATAAGASFFASSCSIPREQRQAHACVAVREYGESRGSHAREPNFPLLSLIRCTPQKPMSSLEVSGVCRSGKHWSISTRKLALRLGYFLAIYRSNLSPAWFLEPPKTGLLSDPIREVDNMRTDVFPLPALGGTCVNLTGTWTQNLHSWTVDADTSEPALTDSWQHQESEIGRCRVEMEISWRYAAPLFLFA